MNNDRLVRWSPLSGLLAVFFLIAGEAVISVSTRTARGEMLMPDQIANQVTDHPFQILIGVYIALTSAFLLVWFGASLRQPLKSNRDVGEWLADLAFGGALATALVIAVGLGAFGTAAERIGHDTGLGVEGMIALIDLRGILIGKVAPILMAVLIAATGIASVRSGFLPKWFGWVSLTLVLGLLSPINWAFIVVGVLWIVVVSLWLTIRNQASVSVTEGDHQTGSAFEAAR